MDQNRAYSVISKAPLFSNADERFKKKIAECAQFKLLKKNDILIHEYDPACELYIISQGEFLVAKKSLLHNEAMPLSILKPYDTLGEFPFLDNQPRSTDVISLQDESEVLIIAYDHLKEIAPNSFYQKLSQKLIQNIRQGNEVILEKMEQEVEQNKRIANMGRFITYILLLMVFYDLALKGFIFLSTNPYTSMFASTSVIGIFTIMLTVMIRRMGFPLENYGFNTHHWQRAILESLVASIIFILAITTIKWIYAQKMHTPFIDLQAIVPNAPLGSKVFYTWYFSGMLIYAIFSLFQEFISRGILQSSLLFFLHDKNKAFHANLITSGMFSAMHIHLSTGLAYAVFIPSLLWGWLYNRHRTLLGPVISHLLIGTWAIFILGFQELLAG